MSDVPKKLGDLDIVHIEVDDYENLLIHLSLTNRAVQALAEAVLLNYGRAPSPKLIEALDLLKQSSAVWDQLANNFQRNSDGED